MKLIATTLLALPLTYAGTELQTGQERIALPGNCIEPVATPAAAPTTRTYLLQWDDSLDGDLERPFKQCVVEIERIDRTLSGHFVGNVLGTVRTATFTGEAVGHESTPGDGALWMLQQREPGYVCSYQLSASPHESWDGTWRDSKGRTGSVRLWPAPAEPVITRTTETSAGVLVAARESR